MTKEEAIQDIEKNILPVVGGKSLRMAVNALKQPERKKGKWLFPYGDKKYKRCSVCERDYYSIPHNSNFCPNCGSYNGGENEV